jgi:hypothetical protein
VEKNILELKVEEKDGEYVIRVKGEQAEHFAKCLPLFCCCSPHPGGKSKADASCC